MRQRRQMLDVTLRWNTTEPDESEEIGLLMLVADSGPNTSEQVVEVNRTCYLVTVGVRCLGWPAKLREKPLTATEEVTK